MNKVNKALLVLVIAVFLIVFAARIFQHGLFFDGLIYSSISQNLADGLGSFWQPHFSAIIYPEFYDHPPLVFGMQSVFMKLFDSAFYAEKVYGFIMAISVLVLIVLIWKRINTKIEFQHLFWVPILFWVITPKNSWAFSNNVLENTMAVFSLASVYLLIIALSLAGIRRQLTLLIAGALLLLAFLSKGFPGLFPLVFFGIYVLIFRQEYNWKKGLLDSLSLFLGTALIFFLFFYFNADAQLNITTYIDTQVMGSIAGESRVGSRLVLMKNLFNELIPLLILCLLALAFWWKKGWALVAAKTDQSKWALLFILLGLSASAPMMVSPKISSFYLITALPYFALGLALFILPVIHHYTKLWSLSKFGFKIIGFIGLVSISMGILLIVTNANTKGRDIETFNDIAQIDKALEPRTIISLHSSYHTDWSTIAYLQRYLRVSVERGLGEHLYYLVPINSAMPENFHKVELTTQKFDLLKRNN
ncbi:MAG: 4-amino-4-deoxy-L-arabinose transferase-like glycosyltransferase [Crocinitomix sp.]|jgi:4-amino-4-deoxy-L-arabinose transferase-like glycosyltransferase